MSLLTNAVPLLCVYGECRDIEPEQSGGEMTAWRKAFQVQGQDRNAVVSLLTNAVPLFIFEAEPQKLHTGECRDIEP